LPEHKKTSYKIIPLLNIFQIYQIYQELRETVLDTQFMLFIRITSLFLQKNFGFQNITSYDNDSTQYFENQQNMMWLNKQIVVDIKKYIW